MNRFRPPPRRNPDGSFEVPYVSRGDWYRTSRNWEGPKFYTAPPSDGNGIRIGKNFFPHQYLGPVHRICYAHPTFVADLVPAPWNPTLLAWLDVWSKGIDYVERVGSLEIEDWRRRGWSDRFLDVKQQPSG